MESTAYRGPLPYQVEAKKKLEALPASIQIASALLIENKNLSEQDLSAFIDAARLLRTTLTVISTQLGLDELNVYRMLDYAAMIDELKEVTIDLDIAKAEADRDSKSTSKRDSKVSRLHTQKAKLEAEMNNVQYEVIRRVFSKRPALRVDVMDALVKGKSLAVLKRQFSNLKVLRWDAYLGAIEAVQYRRALIGR